MPKPLGMDDKRSLFKVQTKKLIFKIKNYHLI